MHCKFCGINTGTSSYKGYCQICYKYFEIDNKPLYPTYNTDQGPQYADNGDCICPECGKAFRKLGGHLCQAHDYPTAAVAYKKYGWYVRSKIRTSNVAYRTHMKEIQDPKTISENLLIKGVPTRFGTEHHKGGRHKKKLNKKMEE